MSRAVGPGAQVLITGGAGFIGSWLADLLIEQGYRVRVLDSLDPQVHDGSDTFPEYLNPAVEVVRGDVRTRSDVTRALEGVDVVYHFAAAVGVGQSMYEIARYADVNTRGTAVLLECLIDRPVRRLIVASSMSIYGEGLYRGPDGFQRPSPRPRSQFTRERWELEADGAVLEPVATPESCVADPRSVYALTKYDQEPLCLLHGEAYGIPVVALRFFNVYGPRQALSNPYTGVLAVFAARCLNGNPPEVFEDGQQLRDFVHVRDVATACSLALSTDATGEVFNVGSGEPRTILSVANAVVRAVGSDVVPVVTGRYRVGDVRHCYADISQAQAALGFRPAVEFDDGLAELADWLKDATADDRSAFATEELDRRNLRL